MKKFKFFLPLALLTAVGFVFTACDNEKDPVTGDITVSTQPAVSLDFTTNEADSKNVVVVISKEGDFDVAWDAQVSNGNDWITISDKEGTTFKVTVTENTGDQAREGEITVTATGAKESHKLTVKQVAYTPPVAKIILEDYFLEYFPYAGYYDLTVTIENADDWDATPSEDWISFTKTNSTSARVRVAANPNATDRDGKLTFSAGTATAELKINQWEARTDAGKYLGFYDFTGDPFFGIADSDQWQSLIQPVTFTARPNETFLMVDNWSNCRPAEYFISVSSDDQLSVETIQTEEMQDGGMLTSCAVEFDWYEEPETRYVRVSRCTFPTPDLSYNSSTATITAPAEWEGDEVYYGVLGVDFTKELPWTGTVVGYGDYGRANIQNGFSAVRTENMNGFRSYSSRMNMGLISPQPGKLVSNAVSSNYGSITVSSARMN